MLQKTTDRAIALEQRKQEKRFRQLKSVVPVSAAEILLDGKQCLNFGSNDYLGLSQHPALKERAIEYVSRYGVGSGASRLVSGNLAVYAAIEDKLARLKGTEAALIFSTGYQLNLTSLLTLASGDGRILCDRLSHNSLILGARFGDGQFHRYRHNDLADLERLIGEQPARAGWIVSESVFGMDGDLADLAALNTLAHANNFRLFIDEAHSTGVFGDNGMGLARGLGGDPLVMGTFGKGLGSFGAYVACSQETKDYLINFCPGFIYTTALPPAVLGAVDAGLDLVPSMGKERSYLQSLAKYVRTELKTLGFDVGASASQIVPIILGDDAYALSASQYLAQHHVFAPVIRPPTVPENTARLRLSLSTLHSDSHITKLLNTLKTWRQAPHQ